jgi:KDO2-lipid IV(A) lauroyltransferase
VARFEGKCSLSRKKDILRAFGRGVLYVVIILVRALPLPAGLGLGRALGSLFCVASKKRYKVALKNLRIAFGDKLTETEREQIAKASFRHAGMFAIEGIKFAYMPQEEVERRIKVDCYEDFEDAISGKKGCLFISAHVGNFEIMGRWFRPRGYELMAIARAARDRGTTDIMLKMRERMGIKVYTLDQSLRPIFAGLKRNACVAIICDQNAADIFVPFFGQPTGTVDGPARIALKMGTPMLFPYCIRDGRGGYIVRSEGVYDAVPTGDEKADIARVMTEVNRRIESIITKHPEQWFWFHDRWRSSPNVVDPAEADSSAASALRSTT